MGIAPAPDQTWTLGPLQSRLLRPMFIAPVSSAVGQPEPVFMPEPVIVERGSRPGVSTNGQIVAGGGYPAPIRRTASFHTFFKALPPVNLVTGVKAYPNNNPRRS